jgi:Zn-dependent protease with chaperone function
MLLFGGILLFGVIEAAFLRPRERRNDEVLDLGANPSLAALLTEVAEAIGTRPVTRVYVTPGAELAIREEGGLGRLLIGRGERCMRVGVGLLAGLEVRELEALLAFEYGHLRVTGTAGGGFALSFDRMLALMEDALGESGAASVVNPAWLFLRGFRRVFHDISRGARRLQALCADQWAAKLYGVDALARGLRHVIAARARLEAHTHATLDEVVRMRRGLTNLYTYRTHKPPDERRIGAAIHRAWHGDEGDASSSPAARVARISNMDLPAVATRAREPGEAAWSLFASRDALETSMTDALRNDLARRGITVADADELDPAIGGRPAALAE